MNLSLFAAEPAEVALAGRPYLAPKFRLRDIAYLEGWIGEVAAEAGAEHARSATIGSRAGQVLLDTGEGAARMLFASLRRSVPGLDLAGARDLAESLGPGDFDRFVAAVFPARDDEDGEPGPPRAAEMDWLTAILVVAERYKYAPDVILDMPLDQFFAMGQDPAERRRKMARKRWAIPIVHPGDIARMLAERGGVEAPPSPPNVDRILIPPR